MSFITVLKDVGKKIGDAAPWIEKGLEVAGQIVSVVDPPLAPIITSIESYFGQVTTKLNESQVQAIVTAIATLEAVKSGVSGAASS